ncbi:hypothetical protein ACSSS7_007559 [Eimeria intestinalis]
MTIPSKSWGAPVELDCFSHKKENDKELRNEKQQPHSLVMRELFPSLQSSATAKRLVLGVAVLQRECLTELFCPSNSSREDALSSRWKEGGAFEAECMHRAVCMSVGLPDVPSCTFVELDCLDGPLRAHLPCPVVLQAEKFLAASSHHPVSNSFADEQVFEIALESALRLEASAQPLSSLPPPWRCQRLPAIMQDLLMHTSSRTLHEYTYELDPEGHLARLRPAGELLLNLLDVCLNILRKEGEGHLPEASPKEREGEKACLLKRALEVSKQGVKKEEGCLLFSEKRGRTLQGDLKAQDLRLFLTRLRAESEALAALKGISQSISRLHPVDALLALEQLMQQPGLQHLPSFRAPPYEVLREVFYDCLLRCFSFSMAHSFSEVQQQDRSCMRLIDKCREALKKAGLWQICRVELEAAPPRSCLGSCCKETAYSDSPGDNICSNADALLERRQQQQQQQLQQPLLLLPPERCEATAKALCSFIFPELRPASPWLPPPPHSASQNEKGGFDPSQEKAKHFANVSLEAMEGGSSNASATSHVRPLHAQLWAHLRALDENLRPSGISVARQRRLHRQLVSWLKRKARSGAEWLGCRKAAKNGGETPSLVPLLLPYGSSASGFGAWASDVDLCLLLPSCRGDSTKPQGRTAFPQRAKGCLDTEEKVTHTGSSGSSTEKASCCCCWRCTSRDAERERWGGGGEGRIGLKTSWSREAQVDVLSRLKEELIADSQMQSAFIDLEVVVPSSAPPLLRGIHLQRRNRRKRGGARSRPCLEAETGGNNSKSLHSLCPLERGKEHRTGGDVDDRGDARDRQDREGNALLLDCSASQLEKRVSKSQVGSSGTGRDASPSRSDSQKREGLHQHVEVSEQGGDAFNVGPVPSQATHDDLDKTDSTGVLREPQTHEHEGSMGRWLGGSVAVKFDVTVGSALGPLNSLLLRAYERRCPLLSPLARIIKHWADCRRLTGTREGNLSSYAWSLLVISFALSTTSPPVLSSLQGPSLSLPPQQREWQAPTTRAGRPLCEASLARIPVELLSGYHNIWFFNEDSEAPLGSRVEDLLRPVFHGSTDLLLLQLVQRYVPGHVLLLPPAQRKGSDCLGESEPQAAKTRLSHDSRESGRVKRRHYKRRHHRRYLGGSELSEEEWRTLASLFHAFFVFYGYHFNCCALLASLRSPPLCCKRSFNKWGCVRKGEERSETLINSAASKPPPSSPGRQVQSMGASGNSRFNCSCVSPRAVSTGDTTPTEEAQKDEDERESPKDVLHARGSSDAASSSLIPIPAEEGDEWRLVVEGTEEHRGQREDLLRFIESMTEGGDELARSSAFGIEVEDPIEAGRFLRFRRTRGSELFLHEVRRAERLLRNGCSNLKHLFVGD